MRFWIVGSLACAIALCGFEAPARAQITVRENSGYNDNYFANDPAGAIAHARSLIASGDMAGAIKGLSIYVNSHPDEVAPKRFLGDLYFRSGQVDRAKFIYQVIIAANPNDKETHNRLGNVYAIENDVGAAIEEYNAALPGTDSVGGLVAMHVRKGDLASYQSQMATVAAQFPTDSAIQTEVGQIYAQLHQPYVASTYFRRALDNDPHDIAALNGLGIALMNMHDYDGSANAFQSCLSVEPLNYECLNDLGAEELEAKSYLEAKLTLDRAHAVAPERAETFVNYGYLADAQGDWQKAASQYAHAIELFPYLIEAYVDLGLTYQEHGKYQLAQATLLKGIASTHDDGRLHDLLGDTYAAQGDRTDAAKEYAIAATGSDPTAASLGKQHVASLAGASPIPTIH